jgi:AcrR family transcriptional regulator
LRPGAGDQRRRRTQAERSAATRSILLEAAIACLFEQGFGATTTSKVAQKAGVSRGAMLHQFPSKADLMTFVVESSCVRDLELYRELLMGAQAPRERLVAYPAAAWEVLSRPSGVAVLEVLQGSRSDPELARKLAPVLERIDAAASAQLSREFPAGSSRALRQLVVGAMHGLAMMSLCGLDDEGVREAVPLLQKLLRSGLQAGVLDPEADRRVGRGAARVVGTHTAAAPAR